MAKELEVAVMVARQLEANTRLVCAAQVHQLDPPRNPFIFSLSHVPIRLIVSLVNGSA
jgi:hypothetical protein